jgi:hypothetical protein
VGPGRVETFFVPAAQMIRAVEAVKDELEKQDVTYRIVNGGAEPPDYTGLSRSTAR